MLWACIVKDSMPSFYTDFRVSRQIRPRTLKERAKRPGCDRTAYEDSGPTKWMPYSLDPPLRSLGTKKPETPGALLEPRQGLRNDPDLRVQAFIPLQASETFWFSGA